MTVDREPAQTGGASAEPQGYLELDLGPVPDNDAREMARRHARARLVPALFIAIGTVVAATVVLTFVFSMPDQDPMTQVWSMMGIAVLLVVSLVGVLLTTRLMAAGKIRGRAMVFGRITGMAYQAPPTSQMATVLRFLRVLPPAKPEVAGRVRNPDRMPSQGIMNALLPLAHIHYVYGGELREWEGYVHAPALSSLPASLGLVGCLARLAVRPEKPDDVVFMEVFPREGYPASLPAQWPFRRSAEAEEACGPGGPQWWLAQRHTPTGDEPSGDC
jgi:hypothetical protein